MCYLTWIAFYRNIVNYKDRQYKCIKKSLFALKCIATYLFIYFITKCTRN